MHNSLCLKVVFVVPGLCCSQEVNNFGISAKTAEIKHTGLYIKDNFSIYTLLKKMPTLTGEVILTFSNSNTFNVSIYINIFIFLD